MLLLRRELLAGIASTLVAFGLPLLGLFGRFLFRAVGRGDIALASAAGVLGLLLDQPAKLPQPTLDQVRNREQRSLRVFIKLKLFTGL